MKILHLEFGRHLYGGALQVAFLLKGLEALPEFESHLICPRDSKLPSRIPGFPQERVHAIRVAGEADPGVWFRLRKVMRTVSPDLVHIHSRRGADLWGILLARQAGLPYILTRRVDNPEARWLARWRTRKAAFVVGISGRICEVMAECGVEEAKIRRILSRVDTRLYKPGGDHARLEAAAGLEPGQPAVGMIAQLIERKGHRVLFEAIPDVLQTHPQTVFLIFGKGPLKERLEREVAAQPWGRQVRFMGFRDDMAQLLPALDVVAHPAFMEGLGVSLLQAAACGVPIVASRAGGIPEIVRHEENGFLIEPGDSRSLARHLSRLLADSDLRRQFARKGRAIAETEFSVAGMVEAYVQLYRETLRTV